MKFHTSLHPRARSCDLKFATISLTFARGVPTASHLTRAAHENSPHQRRLLHPAFAAERRTVRPPQGRLLHPVFTVERRTVRHHRLHPAFAVERGVVGETTRIHLRWKQRWTRHRRMASLTQRR